MEINITSLLSLDMFAFSHSRMEGGDNAGQNTWNAAKEHAASMHPPLLATGEAIDAFRDWVADFGAWTEDKIATWDATECNALFLQFIAGDVREAGADDLESLDWDEYENDCQSGRIAGNFFRSENGQIFYNLSR